MNGNRFDQIVEANSDILHNSAAERPSIQGTATGVSFLRSLVEVVAECAHVLALLHQLLQRLSSLQYLRYHMLYVVQVLMHDALCLLQRLLQFLELVHFLWVLELLNEFLKLWERQILIDCMTCYGTCCC